MALGKRGNLLGDFVARIDTLASCAKYDIHLTLECVASIVVATPKPIPLQYEQSGREIVVAAAIARIPARVMMNDMR